MRNPIKSLLLKAMELTPYRIIRRKGPGIRPQLPEVTLRALDLVLTRYLASKKAVTLIQVGACDGIHNDPVRWFIQQPSVKAILVEPNPFAFTRLQRIYGGVPNVILIQAAIAEQDGEIDLYRVKKSGVSESEIDRTLQFTSMYREHLLRHKIDPDRIERITVSSYSLSSLASKFGLEQIDVLQIDAEGFDAEVVRMALKMPVPPDILHFEHRHIKTAERAPLFDLLKAKDYLVCHDSYDLLALKKSVMEKWIE